MTVPDPDEGVESEEGEVDPFEALGVEATPSGAALSDGLAAFMDDDDEEEDMFETLGVGGPSVALASSGENDILAAFMDDDEEEEPVEAPSEPSTESAPPQDDAMDAYRMVLETVWVDGILDPGEVHLLAKRREALGLTFEEHLALVREMLG
ncbi:MAG: hypothetical protein MKZ56_03795 [Candidatus Thalassarchaeum sp.]|nr:hypothetical protein [Candidatus Thalassarchaeum sp.]